MITNSESDGDSRQVRTNLMNHRLVLLDSGYSNDNRCRKGNKVLVVVMVLSSV